MKIISGNSLIKCLGIPYKQRFVAKCNKTFEQKILLQSLQVLWMNNCMDEFMTQLYDNIQLITRLAFLEHFG